MVCLSKRAHYDGLDTIYLRYRKKTNKKCVMQFFSPVAIHPFYASALECNKNFFDGKRKLRDGCCGLVHNATIKNVSYLYLKLPPQQQEQLQMIPTAPSTPSAPQAQPSQPIIPSPIPNPPSRFSRAPPYGVHKKLFSFTT